MLVLDNQQATNWFVGILEGEGSFQVRDSGSPRITIPNNDKDIIETCKSFLDKNLILSTVYEVKAGKKIGYKLCITANDCNNLYTLLGTKVECRNNEFQRIIGASEIERELSVNFEWLIGIWEAEGSFILSQNHRKSLTPKIELDNTNPKIIEKIKRTLKILDLSSYYKDYEPLYKKPYTKVAINGLLRCQRFLIKTREAWQSNRNLKRTNLLLKFVEGRLRLSQGYEYTAEQIQIHQQLKDLNR